MSGQEESPTCNQKHSLAQQELVGLGRIWPRRGETAGLLGLIGTVLKAGEVGVWCNRVFQRCETSKEHFLIKIQLTQF